MKRQFFLTLVFSVLLLFALNLQGDISYTNHPLVGVANSSFTKYVNTQTGEETWYRDWLNGTVTVYVSADMEGVGQGQGTLTNISIMGNSIATWDGSVSDAGSASSNGSWSSGTGTARSHYNVSIPDNASDGDTWSWSAGGSTTIWPWEWHETVSWGVNVSIPTGASGRYTTTGGWVKGTTITRSANSASGTITLNIVYTGGDDDSDDDDSDSSSSTGCTTSTNADYCDDQGSCSVGSGPGVPGPVCGENYCCCSSYDDSGSDPGSESDGPGDDGCTTSTSADWCDDQGSCSVGSGPGVPGPVCGENYCCCSPSDSSNTGSPPADGNTGSNNGNSGSSNGQSGFGCSNDPDNDWCSDDGTCLQPSGSGVPSPDCGHNYCCCSAY